MIGISVNKKMRIWVIVAAIVLVAGAVVALWRHGHRSQPETDVRPIIEQHPVAKVGPSQANDFEIEKKQSREKTLSTSEQPAYDYAYPVEMEEIFIDQAMDAMPKLIEVEVHEPGVIFFRYEPDRPEAIKDAMEDLAERYKLLLNYNEPINVVFFISGRPAKARVFFRD